MNLHFIPKQFGFQTYLNRIVLFQGIVIKLKQENIHKTLDWQKYAGGAIYTGFYLYFFLYNAARTQARSNREQWDIILACPEEIGTRLGFSRQREKIN